MQAARGQTQRTRTTRKGNANKGSNVIDRHAAKEDAAEGKGSCNHAAQTAQLESNLRKRAQAEATAQQAAAAKAHRARATASSCATRRAPVGTAEVGANGTILCVSAPVV